MGRMATSAMRPNNPFWFPPVPVPLGTVIEVLEEVLEVVVVVVEVVEEVLLVVVVVKEIGWSWLFKYEFCKLAW